MKKPEPGLETAFALICISVTLDADSKFVEHDVSYYLSSCQPHSFEKLCPVVVSSDHYTAPIFGCVRSIHPPPAGGGRFSSQQWTRLNSFDGLQQLGSPWL